jgi:hypothetical protein
MFLRSACRLCPSVRCRAATTLLSNIAMQTTGVVLMRDLSLVLPHSGQSSQLFPDANDRNAQFLPNFADTVDLSQGTKASKKVLRQPTVDNLRNLVAARIDATFATPRKLRDTRPPMATAKPRARQVPQTAQSKNENTRTSSAKKVMIIAERKYVQQLPLVRQEVMLGTPNVRFDRACRRLHELW